MNRKLALLSVVLLAGVLASCGGDDEPDIGEVVEQAANDAADESSTGGDASSSGDESSSDDTGGDPGACLPNDEVSGIVGFDVELNPGSSGTNCAYTSTDPEQIGGSVTYSIDASGGAVGLDAAREILEQTFEDGNIEDSDVGDDAFFFDAGIVAQLLFTDDEQLYTIVLGGLDLGDAKGSLEELADAIR